MSDLRKQLSKVTAVTQEVEASFRFIETGLINLRSTKFVGANNYVTLQLLAAGFERLLKILLLLKHKYLHGEFPKQAKAHKYFSKYRNGHGIEELLKELLLYADDVPLLNSVPMVADDLAYLKNDPAFKNLLHILTEFAVAQRYFYIDTIVLDNFNPAVNPFELFSDFIYDFNQGVDTSGLTYEQEDQRAIKEAMICIEKGVRAISRFFTHGLDSLGRQYYGDFSRFILLKEEDLGSLKYTEPKVSAADAYLPMSKLSIAYLKLTTTAHSQVISATEQPDWAFTVPTVKVFSVKQMFYFAKIGSEIFALTGLTSSRYKIPVYFKSRHLKPKGYALYLLETAKKLK